MFIIIEMLRCSVFSLSSPSFYNFSFSFIYQKEKEKCRRGTYTNKPMYRKEWKRKERQEEDGKKRESVYEQRKEREQKRILVSLN